MNDAAAMKTVMVESEDEIAGAIAFIGVPAKVAPQFVPEESSANLRKEVAHDAERLHEMIRLGLRMSPTRRVEVRHAG